MALIKCPECGKDISESAVKCPNCGYPLKEEKKKKEKIKRQIVICPECNNQIDTAAEVCPYCGKPLKSHMQKAINRAQKFWSKKTNKFLAIGIAVVLIAIIIIVQKFSGTIFDEYTQYLGKNANKLPNSFVHEESVLDDEYTATPENGVKIFDIDGEMNYCYSKADDVEDNMKNVIDSIGWHSEYGDYSQSDIDKFVQKLEDEYGSYDKKEIYELDWLDMYPYPKAVSYVWENEKGITISFHANEYHEDDFNKKYGDEDEITSFSDMHLWWTIADDE